MSTLVIPEPFATTVRGLPSGAIVITQMSDGVESAIIIPPGAGLGLCNAIHHALDREPCPHGRVLGECPSCDAAGDHAYDAAREDRVFGRGR